MLTSHLILRGQFSLLGFAIEVYTWFKKGVVTSTFDTAGGCGCLLVISSLKEEIWYLLVLKQLGLFVRLRVTVCAVAETIGLPLHIHSHIMSFRKEKKNTKPHPTHTYVACFLHHISGIKKDRKNK